MVERRQAKANTGTGVGVELRGPAGCATVCKPARDYDGIVLVDVFGFGQGAARLLAASSTSRVDRIDVAASASLVTCSARTSLDLRPIFA